MCRLPGADGTWMIVQGGMGTITKKLAAAAQAAGVKIETGRGVQSIQSTNGIAGGVTFKDGSELKAKTIVVNADPFRLRQLIGQEKLPAQYNARLDNYKRDGTTMKVNLALKDLPRFNCLPENRGQFGSTMHLLPDEPDVMRAMHEAFADVKAGRLPQFPTIEWYVHTTVDPSMRDPQGHHNSALFVQWVPYELKGTSWPAEEARYVKHLLSICDKFAPGTSDLVADVFALPPPKIEQHFGISRGHIHHVDNTFGFSDRLPCSTPVQGIYSCSAGCHPAGSVIGAAGHNAAERVLRDLLA
jgi:phytoene dehydrogenase-like protein